MTNRNVSKLILFFGMLVSLAGGVILIIFKAQAEYVISCFTLATGFSSSIMTYVNSGKETIGGSNVNETSTSTTTASSAPILSVPK